MLHKLAVSSISSLAAPLAAAISAFFVTPVLLMSLGGEVYGLWVFCASFVTYAGLLDLGMAGTATRFLAGALGESESARQASLFLTFRRFYRTVGTGLLALGVLIAAGSQHFEDSSTWSQGLLVAGILIISCAFGFYFRVHSAILRAHLEYQAISVAGVLRTTAYTAVVLLAAEHFDLVALALLFAALSLGEQFVVWLQARRFAPSRCELNAGAPADFRPLFRHAAKSVVGSVASVLRWKADTQIIGSFVSLNAVTHYSVGMKLPQLFFDLLYTLFGSQFIAAFAQWRTRNPKADPREIVALMMRVCAVISFSGACVLFFVIPHFIECWLGPGYDDAKQLALILLPFWGFMTMPIPLSQLLIAESRHGRIAKLSICGAVGNIVIGLLLVGPFGAKGVVIATACEMFALIIAYSWWVAPQVGWNPPNFFFRQILFPYLRFAILATPVCGLLARMTLSPNYPALIGGSILLSATSLTIAILTITGGRDRRRLLALTKTWLNQ